jgi:glycine/D-amino acid oxidase-like deaminating enzyme
MEVVVVGGGIVGCAAAAHLAVAGARVALFEASEIGAGASGRNSGAIQHPFDPVLAALHRETVTIYRDLEGFPMPAEPAGLLLLTDEPHAAAARAKELMDAYPELHPEVLDSAALGATEPMLASGLSAVRLETAYPVPPAGAVRAFADRAQAAGARIAIGNPVASVDAGGVTLGDGTHVAADAVLLAAGPWTTDLLEQAGPAPIVRTWGVTVQVEGVPPARHVLEEGVVHTVNRTVAPVADFESLFSMVSVGAVSTIGSTFLAAEPDPATIGPLLVTRGSVIVPALRDARVLRARACARPQSIDGRPLVGRVADAGLVVAAGHGPWGISTGPATARMAADLLLGREPVIPRELDPNRFASAR